MTAGASQALDLQAERNLIRRARDGSQAAFTQLMEAHQDRLYRFLLSRAAIRADAEDAMQESFINAYRYLASYKPRWRFSTWLYRIALRELGKMPRPAAYDTALQEESSREPDPLAACIKTEERENLWLLARQVLGEDAFTALWLRYAEDLPVRDVAHVMGRPASWVKVVAHRARKRLELSLDSKQRAGSSAEHAYIAGQ